MSRALQTNVVIACFLVTTVMQSQAAIVNSTWSSTQDGDWSHASNWSNGIVPNNAEDLYHVLIDGGNFDASVSVRLDMNASIRDLSMSSGDRLDIRDGYKLTVTGQDIGGVIKSRGEIVVGSVDSPGELRLLRGADLSGGGTLTLTNDEAYVTGELLNHYDHLIHGFGQLGRGELGIRNAAIISADVAGKSLVVKPSRSYELYNSGIMNATNGGELWLDGTAGGAFRNGTGVIMAENDSTVIMRDAYVDSGILAAVEGARIIVQGESSILQDVNVHGLVTVLNHSALEVQGTVGNHREIRVGAEGETAKLHFPDGAGFTAGGVIRLGSDAATVDGSSFAQAGHRVEGYGQFGMNQLEIINQGGGFFHANVAGKSLILDPSAIGLQNQAGGILRANDGGVLELSGNGGGDFFNRGGVVVESIVRLTQGARLENQMFGTVVGDGTLDAADGIFVNSGALHPGKFASVGTLTIIGDVNQEATGTLHMEISSSPSVGEYDRLTIRGGASLDGILDVVFAAGVYPEYGDAFTLLTHEGSEGEFAALRWTGTIPAAGLPPLRVFYGESRTTLAMILDGDANADGVVNVVDLNLVRNNFGSSHEGVAGDTNYDDAVDIEDLNRVRNNFGSVQSSPVPEPSAFVLATLAVLVFGYGKTNSRSDG
ncbi:MAG: hypothetical protein SGJ19_24680 [Planctomycetia bacterium]|nr:hypothetical protein [Planctomycetia bacterium]